MNITGGMNRIGDIYTTEEERDQVAASAEDSEMDQMINVPTEKKKEQLKRLEEDAYESKDGVAASAEDSEMDEMKWRKIKWRNEKKKLEEDADESKDEK